jgi:hypothetical protein
MNISGEQKGRTLTITVDFDEPAQMYAFNQYFEEMLKKFASDHGAEMITSSNNDEASPVTSNMSDVLYSKFSKREK